MTRLKAANNVSPYPKPGFHRSVPFTVFGLVNTVAGFLSVAGTLFRMQFIGFSAALHFSTGLAVLIYCYEATSLLLWISGIGLLRGKSWGVIFAVAWSVCGIFFHLLLAWQKSADWGVLSPGLTWSGYLVIYYALALAGTLYLYPAVLKLYQTKKIRLLAQKTARLFRVILQKTGKIQSAPGSYDTN